MQTTLIRKIPGSLRRLMDTTTIVQLEDARGELLLDRTNGKNGMHLYQREQADLKKLRRSGRRTVSSAGKQSLEDRDYRLFYDAFKLFYYSYNLLRLNKLRSTNGDRQTIDYYNDQAGISLVGMYLYGKNCIDIIERSRAYDGMGQDDRRFLKKFRATSDRVFGHRSAPQSGALLIQPMIWRTASPHFLLDILVFDTATETDFKARIDYYEDYFRLEDLITGTLDLF